jgi:hypothetical protein
MAHGGDGGAPPCGCWNASRRRLDGSHGYRSVALTARPPGAHCSTAHYRRDDRAPGARELQLIMKVTGRALAATPIQPGKSLSLLLTPRTACRCIRRPELRRR